MMSYYIYSQYSLGTYFEYPLLVIQDIVMLVVVLGYVGTPTRVLVWAVFLLSLMTVIMTGVLPHAIITILVVSICICYYLCNV